MTTTEASVIARVDADYTATRARLTEDPEYQRLSDAAEHEARETPHTYLARNLQAIYVETHMPPIPRG